MPARSASLRFSGPIRSAGSGSNPLRAPSPALEAEGQADVGRADVAPAGGLGVSHADVQPGPVRHDRGCALRGYDSAGGGVLSDYARHHEPAFAEDLEVLVHGDDSHRIAVTADHGDIGLKGARGTRVVAGGREPAQRGQTALDGEVLAEAEAPVTLECRARTLG